MAVHFFDPIALQWDHALERLRAAVEDAPDGYSRYGPCAHVIERRTMHDMLVRLYDLPSLEEAMAAIAGHRVTVRRALAPERQAVLDWVRTHFASSAAEVGGAFERVPATCFIAIRDRETVGFACHDVTCRNFFGPEGVAATERGRGIGRALLLAALHAQHAQGYAYAIIGGVGPAEFYAKTVGAVPIAGSTPGIYADVLPYMKKAGHQKDS
jgi:GNAT superfamily N-acetyltransferase